MSKKIAYSELNASTIDIMNVIRANASLEYQNQIPQVERIEDIPKVGESILGYPAFANQYINALVNRIAFVVVHDSNFSNPFWPLRKGTYRYGDNIEEVFVGMLKAREFSAEKAPQRELQRTLPNVKVAFHPINWDIEIPVSIENDMLARAFLDESGMLDMIAKITESITRTLEYLDYNLFKYLIIKGYNQGEIYKYTIPSGIGKDEAHDAAIAFRGMSNMLTFVTDKYNVAGVHTSTPRSDQFIFMDAAFNAAYDINVLSASFQMDKAEFLGRLILIDSFTTFDNDAFSAVRAGSTMIEEVTEEELQAMENVKAIIADQEYFQVYQNEISTGFAETFIRSGRYWNYSYRDCKVVSTSPFSNCVAIESSAG